jgi:2-oxoglutarate dehydrogenase E1 component
MGTMKELESTSTLFGSNAPFIEELYESYLTDPANVSGEWRSYFDEPQGRCGRRAHAGVLESFRELARNRRVAGAMVDETTMHKQVLVLRLISKFRTLGMLHAGSRSTEAPGTGIHSRPRPSHLRVHRNGSRYAVRRRLVQGGPRADAPARHHRCAEGHVHAHVWRRVHVHLRHADEALRAGAAGADPLAPEYQRGRARHILERLTAAETLERYLHTKYVGQKRFSGEGGDSMIPMLDL